MKIARQTVEAHSQVLLPPMGDMGSFIQAAWFRYKRQKDASELKAKENSTTPVFDQGMEQKGAGLAFYAVKLVVSTRRGGIKPMEHDFTVDNR